MPRFPTGSPIPASNADLTTELLAAVRSGDGPARDQLWHRLYGELKKLAAGHLRGQQATLEPTAVVHEIFLRLAEIPLESQHRRQFLALASTTMRRVLIDRARQRQAAKRAAVHVALGEAAELPAVPAWPAGSRGLETALAELEAENPQLGRLVELRTSGGLTIEEIGRELDLAPATVKRKWRLARAWLWQKMSDGHG